MNSDPLSLSVINEKIEDKSKSRVVQLPGITLCYKVFIVSSRTHSNKETSSSLCIIKKS